MKRFFIYLGFLLLAGSVSGQKLEMEAEVLLQSRHFWRGEQMGNTVAIEPSVTFLSGRFSFNIWAAVTTNNSYSEIDLIPSWQFNEFAITLLDYYNPVPEEKNQFLNFKKDISRHSLELSIDNYSVEKRRLKWMVGTFLLGDRNDATDQPFYSTYIELKYPFALLGIETEPFVGISPFRGYYADNFAVVNTGISFGKELDFKLPFTIPLSLSFVSNPNTRQGFVILAGGIAF